MAQPVAGRTGCGKKQGPGTGKRCDRQAGGAVQRRGGLLFRRRLAGRRGNVRKPGEPRLVDGLDGALPLRCLSYPVVSLSKVLRSRRVKQVELVGGRGRSLLWSGASVRIIRNPSAPTRVHSTSPITFILLTTCVCSNALFSNDTDTCRLMTNAARIRNSVATVAGNHTPSGCR